jgi:cell division protein FtsB
MTPNRVWLSVFGLWMLFLSGALVSIVGSPGILQLIRLDNLLVSKRTQIAQLQDDIRRLNSEAVQLEKNPLVQMREIRRVLGYAGPGEIIFDFSSSGQW